MVIFLEVGFQLLGISRITAAADIVIHVVAVVAAAAAAAGFIG